MHGHNLIYCYCNFCKGDDVKYPSLIVFAVLLMSEYSDWVPAMLTSVFGGFITKIESLCIVLTTRPARSDFTLNSIIIGPLYYSKVGQAGS